LEEIPTEESGLEYSSNLSYHDAPMAGTGWILMIPVSDLEVHPSASKAKVPTDVPMEEEENGGSLTEERSMSPLHQEEGVLPIVS